MQISWLLTFSFTRGKHTAAAAVAFLGSKVILWAMIFGVDKYSWRDWYVTFTFQIQCVCNLPLVNACIHIQERHWLPLALALSQSLSVSMNTEPTCHKGFEARMLTELPTACPVKKKKKKIAICELASKMLMFPSQLIVALGLDHGISSNVLLFSLEW